MNVNKTRVGKYYTLYFIQIQPLEKQEVNAQ
jgi:hypothetical protein